MMAIEISQKDFGTLCICALRYCHGRQTYMPQLVQSIVAAHFADISSSDLKIIENDKQFQTDLALFGDKNDQIEWLHFYERLERYRRENELL